MGCGFLGVFSRVGVEYGDVREDCRVEYRVVVENGRVVDVGVARKEGVFVRVLRRGCWGYASVCGADVEGAVNVAASMACACGGGDVKLADAEFARGRYVVGCVEAPEDAFPDAFIEFGKSVCGEVLSLGDFVKHVSVEVLSVVRRVRFLSTEGVEAEGVTVRTVASVSVVAGEGGSLWRRRDRFGGLGGFEKVRCVWSSVVEAARRMGREAYEISKAPYPKGGVYRVVLSPALTGTLLHEAFGHASEGDLVARGYSVLRGMVGKVVASELVTYVDDPTAPYFGYYPFDHEGVIPKRVTIVEKGVLKAFMTGRESAAKLGMEATGHCKAEDFRHPPIVRQSNTIMLPGDMSFDEMVSELRNGLVLGDPAGGQASPEGTFSFSVQYVAEVRNGEVTRLLKGTTVSGNMIETLKNVVGVGKEVVEKPGACGKHGQWDMQGRVVPPVMVEAIRVGGE